MAVKVLEMDVVEELRCSLNAYIINPTQPNQDQTGHVMALTVSSLNIKGCTKKALTESNQQIQVSGVCQMSLELWLEQGVIIRWDQKCNFLAMYTVGMFAVKRGMHLVRQFYAPRDGVSNLPSAKGWVWPARIGVA